MRVAGVLVASGRAWSAPVEQYRRTLGGEPLLRWGVRLLAAHCNPVGLVVPPELVADAEGVVGPVEVRLQIVSAVPERWRSLWAAIEALGASDISLVHDVFRPLAPPATFRHVLTEASGSGAAACAIQADAPVCEVDDQHRMVRSMVPERVRLLQTPQGFVTGLLQDAVEAASQHAGTPLDDAAAVGIAGGLVQLVPGDPLNRQLLAEEDYSWAAAVLAARGAR